MPKFDLPASAFRRASAGAALVTLLLAFPAQAAPSPKLIPAGMTMELIDDGPEPVTARMPALGRASVGRVDASGAPSSAQQLSTPAESSADPLAEEARPTTMASAAPSAGGVATWANGAVVGAAAVRRHAPRVGLFSANRDPDDAAVARAEEAAATQAAATTQRAIRRQLALLAGGLTLIVVVLWKLGQQPTCHAAVEPARVEAA